jgi:hypothetical protein
MYECTKPSHQIPFIGTIFIFLCISQKANLNKLKKSVSNSTKITENNFEYKKKENTTRVGK